MNDKRIRLWLLKWNSKVLERRVVKMNVFCFWIRCIQIFNFYMQSFLFISKISVEWQKYVPNLNQLLILLMLFLSFCIKHIFWWKTYATLTGMDMTMIYVQCHNNILFFQIKELENNFRLWRRYQQHKESICHYFLWNEPSHTPAL